MQAEPEEIEALYEVQRIDLETHQLESRLEELPQREIILNCRMKRDAVNEKLSKIVALKKETKKKLTRVNDEDASLQKKEKGVQAAIEAAGNDFRNAEARTKELNGIFKRRNELSEAKSTLDEEMQKIKMLETQVGMALDELDSTEEKAIASFKADGTSLMQSIAANKVQRDELLSKISDDVADLYNRTAEKFDTVSIGRLEGQTCSVCRARIEQGRLIDLMNHAPLANCPACKRLMIIDIE